MNKRAIKIGIAVSLAIIIPAIVYLIYNSPTALAAPSITKDPDLKVMKEEELKEGNFYSCSPSRYDC